MSKYIKVKECIVSEYNENVLLYNPYTIAIYILENYKKKLNVNAIDDTNFNNRILHYFKDQKNIYDSLFSDFSTNFAIANFYSNKFKYQRTLTISDAISYDCNMKCTYCFENNFSEKNKLSSKSRQKLISEIINLYDSDIDYVDYIFFGGEPLLNIDYITSLCDFLTNKYKSKIFCFSFTTNGTLIDERFIDLCKTYPIDEIRITLDGPEVIHNLRRPLKNNKNSFEVINNNIKKLCELTDLRIIINTVIDDKNHEYYINMFEQLEQQLEQYIKQNPVKLIFNIGTTCSPMIKNLKSDKKEKTMNFSHLYYDLAEFLLNKGATITSPLYSAQCLNSMEKAFIISPSGDIYKCITGANNNKFIVSSYIGFNENPLNFIKNSIVKSENSHIPECKKCEFLTMCNGGCKFQHFINGAPLCRKPLLKKELPDLLNLLYLGEFTNDRNFKKRTPIY